MRSAAHPENATSATTSASARFSIIEASMKPITALCVSALLLSAEPKRFGNIRQLTHGGQNAEAYWSPDGKRLIFQSTRKGYECDQIFIMKADGSDQKLVSTGKGRTTCGYFLGDGKLLPPRCLPRWDVYRGTEKDFNDETGSTRAPHNVCGRVQS